MRSLNIKYIPELDQLRGLAATLVLFFHAVAGASVAGLYINFAAGPKPAPSNPLELLVANGFTGVALFFVISGFIFTWGALQTDTLDWKKFYTNRLLRIFPLYVLMLLAVFSLGRGDLTFAEFIQNLTGFGNLSEARSDFAMVLWTISVELQFYMIFPFLITLLKRKGARYLAGIIGILVMLRLVAWLDHINLHDPVYWTMLGRLDQFLVGMILAWIVHHRGWLRAGQAVTAPKLLSAASAKLIGGLVATSALILGLLWLYTQMGWKYGESYLLVVWPVLEAGAWALFGVFYVGLMMRHHPRFIKPIQYVGMISYSLYLLHYPIVRSLQASHLIFEIPGHRFLSGLISTTVEVLPLTILAAMLTYYVIEKPPLELRKRYATTAPETKELT